MILTVPCVGLREEVDVAFASLLCENLPAISLSKQVDSSSTFKDFDPRSVLAGTNYLAHI